MPGLQNDPQDLPVLYSELPADRFDYARHWREAVGDQEPGGGSTLSQDAQESTRVGYIPANMKRSAARWFLGYSYCDNSAPWRLHREPPHVDPEFPNLRAYAVSFTKLGPQGVPENPASPVTLYNPLYVESPFGPGGVSGAGYTTKPMYYPNYQSCLCTVKYRSPGRTLFINDNSTASYKDEWRRWTDIRFYPSAEVLKGTAGSTLTYAEGADNEPKGIQIPSDVFEILPKAKVQVRWLGVPHEYLSTSQYMLFPKKQQAGFGRVNSVAFLDEFPAGTLAMFDPPEFEPTNLPVVSTYPYAPFTGWDCTFTFEWFDPPKGVVSDYRGHNLQIWRGAMKAGENAAILGKFFMATRGKSGSASNPPLLGAFDFHDLFRHVRDAA